MRVVYLHGFASSPESGKARYFSRCFRDIGIDLEIPSLVPGPFEEITITGQIQVIQDTVQGEPAVLMGSSMGGYLAALFASDHPEVQKLILMAPAFHFPQRWPEELGPERSAEWQRKGSMPVFHYGCGAERNVGWGLIEDGQKHDPAPAFHQPALIFHGTRDTIVPPDYSKDFVAQHPNAKLRLFDSDHQLSDVVDEMWTDIAKFIHR